MSKTYAAELLVDRLRLQEVYHLRVDAHERSLQSHIINKKTFPIGLRDESDDLPTTTHFVVKDEERIIAAVRLLIHEGLDAIEAPPSAIEDLKKILPEGRFAEISRQVVHPDFRGHGLAGLLNAVCVNHIIGRSDILYSFGTIRPHGEDEFRRQGFECGGQFKLSLLGKQVPVISIFRLNRMH